MKGTIAKKFFVWLTPACILTCCASGQDAPVAWKATALKINDSSYNVCVTGSIRQGWYVYAATDRRFGLEAVNIHWYNPQIRALAPAPQTGMELMDDKIFKSRVRVYTDTIELVQQIQFAGVVPSAGMISITAFAAKDNTFLPLDQTLEIRFVEPGAGGSGDGLKRASIDLLHPLSGCGTLPEQQAGLMALFLLGIGGGLLALLTPCVFPMIPLTVAYFSKTKSPGRKWDNNCLLYGFFIFLIYVLESLPFHLMGNIDPAIFNHISTSVALNVFFFIVFVLFAVSLFGMFDIRLFGNLSSRAGAKSNLQTRSGLFFMALTLAIVSFSCTGPILGALLAGAITSKGGAWQLSAGMGGFGLGIATPFVFFAFFPGYVRHLPKSGGWMETVKKALAFVELALAFKFLSNADLVAHWGILKREVFLLIWILIFFGMALYLFNVFSKERTKISWRRHAAGGLVFLFVVYLCTGLSNGSYARLSLLSGLPPPLQYSIYQQGHNDTTAVVPDVVNDYDKALLLAKERNKPILVDFTGWACVNCRKMEENVWTKPEVASMIKENFVLLSLYVDDKQALLFPLLYKDSSTTRELVTVGDKWGCFQAENFKQLTQPLYALIGPGEQLLNQPSGYEPDAKNYKNWLQCGLDAYRQP